MTTRQLGPYEVVGPLAAGGMGEVYRARDPRLGRDVAIKVLPAAFATDPDRLVRFEREARAVGQLNHPNVLAVFDVGSADGAPYLVTELLEGETLRERLRGRAISVRKAVDVLAQTARGLAAAHEKGVVHRDLKPENLFVTRDGRVKILDFGLAKLTFQQPASGGADGEPLPTEPGLIVGTAGYMSPEQVKGLPADPRSDIFSLGAILLEMVTGKKQFSRGTLVESLNAILNDEPEGLASAEQPFSPVVGRIARRCLEKNPDERYQSARDLAFALEEVTLSFSGLTREPGAARVAWRRRLNWRWVAAAAGAGIVGLAAGLWFGSRSPRTASVPDFQQLTFRRGTVWSARFAPEGETVLFGARWEGQPLEVYLAQPGQPEARPLQHGGADLLAVSRSGGMLLSRDRRYLGLWVQSGTLARASLSGGEPRDVLEDVEWADFGPDESEIAIVRRAGGRRRLEFPIGTVQHESPGWISHPRVSPDGTSVAFLDHPVWFDDGGSVALVDRSGARTVLDDACTSVQGLAWARDGRSVYYTAARGGANRALYAAAPGGRPRLLLAAPVSLTVHDVAASGAILLAREEVRAGLIARLPGGDEHDLSWLDYSVLRDLSADGRRLLFTEGGQGGGAAYGVYLRTADGAPAVRLGDGDAMAISPDGKLVAAAPNRSPRPVVLLPTGAGQARELPSDQINHLRARWLPGGEALVFVGHEPGRSNRLWVQSSRGGAARPISPEGVGVELAVAPDGSTVAGVDADQQVWLHFLDGAPPRRLDVVPAEMAPVGWSADGRRLFVADTRALPAVLHVLDLTSGKLERVRELLPADPAGLVRVRGLQVAAGGEAYAYSYFRVLSELLVVRGVE